MANKRLQYIDIYKGILIILVIIHHAPMVCEKFHNPYMNISWVNNFIIAFFMPAWFVATGYCTNFNKSFRDFTLTNFKGIMIPCFTLYCINHVLQCANTILFEDSSWMTLSHVLNPGIRTFFIEGGFYWFLSALFIAKILYWLIHKFVVIKYQFILLLGVLLLGVYLYGHHTSHNIFFYQHAMLLTIFLYVGKEIKEREDFLMIYGNAIILLFIAIVVVLSILEINIPTVTREITVLPTTSLLFLILSTIGSISLLKVAKAINTNKILEYAGKGSLVMYAFNYVTLTLVANCICRIVNPSSWFCSVTCLALIVLCSSCVLLVFYWILNHRYINVLLGKF